MPTDFKRPARIRDPKAGSRKLHRDPICRRCGDRATQAHHIVFRGSPHFGDDVEDNMLPLCTDCHVLVHSKGPCYVRLTYPEIQYVLNKLNTPEAPEAGKAYIERRYQTRIP